MIYGDLPVHKLQPLNLAATLSLLDSFCIKFFKYKSQTIFFSFNPFMTLHRLYVEITCTVERIVGRVAWNLLLQLWNFHTDGHEIWSEKITRKLDKNKTLPTPTSS